MFQGFCCFFPYSDLVYTFFSFFTLYILDYNVSFINNLSPLSSFLKGFCVLTALTLWVMGLKTYLLGEMMEWWKCTVLTMQMSLFYDLIRSVHLIKDCICLLIKNYRDDNDDLGFFKSNILKSCVWLRILHL